MPNRIKSFTAANIVSSFGNKLYFQLQNYETEILQRSFIKKIPIMNLEWGAMNRPILKKK